jgi:hypothetical protein
MNKLISPFIVMTDDVDYLISKINDVRSADSLLKSATISDPKFYLAPNQGEIESLEHDFATGRLTIELIDVDRRFEERFLTPQFTKWVQGFPSKEDLELQQIRNTIGDSALYLIYGTETKLPYFAGPVAVYLTGYQIVESEEAGKKITLELMGVKSYHNMPNSDFGHIRDRMLPYPEQIDVSIPVAPIKTLVFDDRQSTTLDIITKQTEEVNRRNQADKSNKSVFDQFLDDQAYAISKLLEKFGKSSGPSDDRFNKSIVFKRYASKIKSYLDRYNETIISGNNIFLHNSVSRCIQKFLQNAFATRNVIVFIKNIEETHAKLIRRAVDSVLTTKVSDTLDTIRNLDTESLSEASKSPDKVPDKPYWQAAIKAIESLGFEGRVYTQKRGQAPSLEYEAKIESKDGRSSWVSKYFEELEFPLSIALKTEFRNDSAGAFKENSAAVKETIENVIRGLQKTSSTDNKQKLKCYVETNINIIRLWHDRGLVPSRTDPVVMFVDEDIHSMFIYPSLAEAIETYSGATKETLIKNHSINELDFLFYQDLLSPDYVRDYYSASFRNLASAYSSEEPVTSQFGVDAGFDYPVFRYNVRNPNVTELTVNFNNLMFEHLRRVISKREDYLSHFYSKIENPVVDDNLNVDFKSLFSNYDAFIADLKDLRDIFIDTPNPPSSDNLEEDYLKSLAYSLGSYVTDDAIDFFGRPGLYDLAQMIYRMQKESSESPDFKMFVGEEVTSDPESLHLDLFRHILNESGGYEVSITTLPYFGIDSTLFLNKPVVLEANSIDVLNQHLGDYPKSALTRYLSGFYYIKDFKHIISADELKSEFTLYRPPSELGIKPDPTPGTSYDLSELLRGNLIENNRVNFLNSFNRGRSE